MSRQQQKRRIAPHIINAPAASATGHTATATAERPVSPSSTTSNLEDEYAHVRRDLKRILFLAVVLIGGMLILRFVVGM